MPAFFPISHGQREKTEQSAQLEKDKGGGNATFGPFLFLLRV